MASEPSKGFGNAGGSGLRTPCPVLCYTQYAMLCPPCFCPQPEVEVHAASHQDMNIVIHVSVSTNRWAGNRGTEERPRLGTNEEASGRPAVIHQ